MPVIVSPGYRMDLEDHEFLARSTAPVFSAPTSFVPPKVMNFRDKLVVEQQGGQGSCVGHAGSTNMEFLTWLAFLLRVAFSRSFMYSIAQKFSGLRGVNSGANVAMCIKAQTEVGCCFEKTMPYGNYVDPSRIPVTAMTEAKKYPILGHQKMQSYDDIFNWLAQAKGGIQTGIPWFNNLVNLPSSGIIKDTTFSGPDVGGHSTLLAGYSGELDEDGYPMIDMINSHGINWGDRGWAKWTRKALNKAIAMKDRRGNSLCEFIATTDITGFDQKRVDTFASLT